MKLELYDYQKEAVKAAFAYLKITKGDYTKAPLIVAPTSSGKSLIQAEMMVRIVKSLPSSKLLSLCHSVDIIEQNYNEFVNHCDDDIAGIYCSKLKRKEVSQVTFSSIQSVVKSNITEMFFDAVFIDECHMFSEKDTGQYNKFVKSLIENNPKIRIIGLTATPWRMDGGCLISGDNKLFSCIVYEIKLKKLIEMGRCTPIVTPEHYQLIKPDLSDLKINNITNDYTLKSQSFTISKDLEIIIDQVLDVAKDRLRFIWFLPSIELAIKAREFLKKRGESAYIYIGSTGTKQRRHIKNKFNEAEARHLLSVNALTTGFNSKGVDCIVLLRATKSSGLYVQIDGRGMRLFPGKINCLLLDYGDNIARHGPIENIESPQPKKKKGDGEFKMVKACPSCGEELHIAKMECNFCGYGYPVIERKYFELAKGKNVLFGGSNQLNTEKWEVLEVTSCVHTKGDKKSLKLEFLLKNRVTTILEFFKFEPYFKTLRDASIRFVEKLTFSTKACEQKSFDTCMIWLKDLTNLINISDYEGFSNYLNDVIPKSILIPEYLIIDASKKYPEIIDIVYKREEK